MSHVWLTSSGTTTTAQVLHIPECDRQLELEVGSPATLCLQLVQISPKVSNASELSVPVMLVNPGTSTSFDILYLLAAANEGHVGPLPNVTSSKLPVVISVPSGARATGRVSFSNASVIFENSRLVIFRYTLGAAIDSDGYYAILPPYYFGMFPALVVGMDPNHLDPSAMSLWAYSGVMESAEFVIPSFIVGTGNLGIVNVTLPIIEDCTNPACVMISHSQS